MTNHDIDDFFEDLESLTEVDLVTLSARPAGDAAAEAVQRAQAVARRRDPSGFEDAMRRLRRWVADAGSYPAAGIAAQTDNAWALQLRGKALPAVHGALLATLAGSGLDREDADVLLEPWSQLMDGEA